MSGHRLSAVPIPTPLAARPRDDRGRPIPWVSGEVDGVPRLGTNNAALCARAILERRCGQCGTPLGYWICFMGDEVSVERREFMEPPMHEGCARYAMAVCPYLANEHYEAKHQLPGVVTVADRARPERMALYVTRGYRPKYGDHPPMAKADAPKRLEWF